MKASTGNRSYTAAKSTLTRILTIAFDTDESEYNTFAMTVASGFSCLGANTDFEGATEGNVLAWADNGDLDELRLRLCALMHIIFTKLKQHKFMVQEEGSNVYRLFYCSTMITGEMLPLFYAFFSFLLQMCLTAYVIWEMIINFEDNVYFNEGIIQNVNNFPLAILTVIYSAILAYPTLQEIPDAFDVYGRRIGIFQMMDVIVNGILPTVLFVCGFFVIWGQDSYIEAVLNTAALLFIPDIDDQLPGLIGVKDASIIKNFLIGESMKEFDTLMLGDKATMKRFIQDAREAGMGIQFADYYLTNVREQASSLGDGTIFQPFQVIKGKNSEFGNQIDPSFDVTEKCLIRKISWRYTVFGPARKTSKPRIGYLKLEMMAGYDVVYQRPKESQVELGIEHSLEGVYVITTFQMSMDILRLRLCGSKSVKDFIAAFQYYALFSMTKGAKGLLKKNLSGQGVTGSNALDDFVDNV